MRNATGEAGSTGTAPSGPWPTRHRLGLRAKFNVVLVPLMAMALGIVLFLDYRHEFRSVMDAHGIHAGRIATVGTLAPIDERTSPRVIARRTIELHLVAGALTLLALTLAVNLTLSRFVLVPIGRVRAGIERLRLGFRAGALPIAPSDEVTDTVTAFDDLGLTIDALTLHALQTERLAVLALLSKMVAADVEPEAQRLAAAAARLHRIPDRTIQQAAHEIAEATARILAAVRRLDRPFAPTSRRPAA